MATLTPLYFVTTNLPGPGARALVGEAMAFNDRLPAAAVSALLGAADDACEFVELETEGGHSARSGAEWGDHPGRGTLKRLGPFYAAQDVDAMRDQLRILAAEVDRINALGGTLPDGEVDEGPGAEGWPSAEACNAAINVLNVLETTPRVAPAHDCEAELKARPDYSVGHGTPAMFDCSCGKRYAYECEESEGAAWELVA